MRSALRSAFSPVSSIQCPASSMRRPACSGKHAASCPASCLPWTSSRSHNYAFRRNQERYYCGNTHSHLGAFTPIRHLIDSSRYLDYSDLVACSLLSGRWTGHWVLDMFWPAGEKRLPARSIGRARGKPANVDHAVTAHHRVKAHFFELRRRLLSRPQDPSAALKVYVRSRACYRAFRGPRGWRWCGGRLLVAFQGDS